MKLFISAGEPSGDLHAGNLLSALRHLDPSIECSGYGGPRLQGAGGELLFPLTELSVMWFPHVLKSLRTFLNLVDRADDWFRDHRPDAVVLIDYPGLHWLIARRAKERGIPVVYFVPPQLWAWGGWRVKKMRRFVDHVICSLPFEPAWYSERGIEPQYFGHPYFDELQHQHVDGAFVTEQRNLGGPIVAVLPGSRRQEVRMNWPSFRRAMQHIHDRHPATRFLVAAFNEEQREQIASSLADRDVPAEVHVGRTPEIIRLADACLSVSGSVGLELLHAGLPSVVSYRIRRIDVPFVKFMMKSRFVSLVNLLADDEVFPEYLTSRCSGEAMGERIASWLDDPAALAAVRGRVERLRATVAQPGACAAAATFIQKALGTKILLEPRLPINTGTRS